MSRILAGMRAPTFAATSEIYGSRRAVWILPGQNVHGPDPLSHLTDLLSYSTFTYINRCRYNLTVISQINLIDQCPSRRHALFNRYRYNHHLDIFSLAILSTNSTYQ